MTSEMVGARPAWERGSAGIPAPWDWPSRAVLTALLPTMQEDAMRGTQSAMKATVKRLTSLLERGDGQPMWYLVTFIVVLFLALYWLIKA